MFDRSRQQISLTAAGDRFRTRAYEVLGATRLAAESVGEFRGSLSGTIEFGSLISFGPLDARALGDFHRTHPFVRLRLRLSQAGASAYLSALVEGSLDLALISVPDRFPAQLEMRLLFEDSMVFVCRKDHALATQRPLDLGDLAGEQLVGSPPEFGLRRLMDGAFRADGVAPHTQYEVPAGFSDMADLVGNGLGTAFMPKSEAHQFSDLQAVELADQVLWQVFLASSPSDQLTPAAARLADALLDAAADAR